jgi:hypothetical protein
VSTKTGDWNNTGFYCGGINLTGGEIKNLGLENVSITGGNYEVLGGFWPGGPLCFVEFGDFARFAEYWLESGTGLAGMLVMKEKNNEYAKNQMAFTV